MSKKWSQKGIKTTLDANDEFMILDSTDGNNATKNKRVKVFTARDSFHGFFETVTFGATSQSQTFIFNGALTAFVIIAASNDINTKGFSALITIAATITMAGNTVNISPVSDFVTAGINYGFTSNSVTINMAGDAGETITWRGKIYVIGT